MTWSDIAWNPSRKILRQFSWLWLVFFSGLACYQGFWHDRVVLAMVLGMLAVSVGPLGLFFPALIRPIYVGWMVLVFPVGWLVSKIIMALLFFSGLHALCPGFSPDRPGRPGSFPH